MTDQTTNLRLSYVMPAQAQKHVTVNESLRRLDALIQTAVESRSVSVQPGAPADGAVWIMPGGKTGPEWGLFGDLALAYYRDGSWEELHPKTGWRVYVRDEDASLVYNGSGWVGELSSPGAIGEVAPAPATFTSLNSGPLAGLRNALVNGGFDIWRRGTSFVGLTSDQYVADRWRFQSSGATGSVARQAFTPGQTDVPGEPAYFARVEVTSADDNAGLVQRIEDVRSFAGQTITVSAYVKSANTPSALRIGLTQNFGSGGSSQISGAVISDIQSVTADWTRMTATLNVPSVAEQTIGFGGFLSVDIYNAANEAWSLDIANVQVELGSVATPFERRPLGLEATLCKRYFERIVTENSYAMLATGVAVNATACEIPLRYERKRANPTISWGGAFRLRSNVFPDVTAFSVNDMGPIACRLTAVVASGLTLGNACVLQPKENTSYFDISAEL